MHTRVLTTPFFPQYTIHKCYNGYINHCPLFYFTFFFRFRQVMEPLIGFLLFDFEVIFSLFPMQWVFFDAWSGSFCPLRFRRLTRFLLDSSSYNLRERETNRPLLLCFFILTWNCENNINQLVLKWHLTWFFFFQKWKLVNIMVTTSR